MVVVEALEREYWTKPPRRIIRCGCLEEILSRIDWSKWEAAYDLTRSQPPIHPRVLASVVVSGLLTRIRSSRALATVDVVSGMVVSCDALAMTQCYIPLQLFIGFAT